MRNQGFSAVGVMVTLVLTTVAAKAFLDLAAASFRTNKHIELKLDLSSLSQTVSQIVDCDETWKQNAIDIKTDCGVAPKVIVLKDSRGNDITSPIHASSGGFVPTANDFSGSGRLGPWSLRAYCDGALGSLVIRAAMPGAGGNGFRSDPLTKRMLDWNGPRNPLFGVPERRLCVGKFAPPPTPSPTPTPTPTPPSTPQGYPLTPRGMCAIVTGTITQSSPLAGNLEHRVVDLACPAQFPVMMSLNTTPACNSTQWQSDLNNLAPEGYPVGGRCAVVLLWDRKDMQPSNGQDQRPAAQQICDGLKMQTHTAQCRAVCCNL